MQKKSSKKSSYFLKKGEKNVGSLSYFRKKGRSNDKAHNFT